MSDAGILNDMMIAWGQFIFVLGLVFLCLFLGRGGRIGGYYRGILGGIALNRLIPNTSALMNRIEFVGNALFIPFFLIGVGMLVNFHVFLYDLTTIWVAVIMCVVATVSKFIPAWLAQKNFRFTASERTLIFGLSNAQAAATLAAVLVGYNVILGTTPEGEPIRLLNESVLNGTIVMILVTCIIASFATQKGAQEVALAEFAEDESVDSEEVEDRILIPLSNIENVEELVSLAVTIKSKKAKAVMTALNVIQADEGDSMAEKKANLLLEKATKAAAATDNELVTSLRYDEDIVNGIKNATKEHKITDIVLGLRKEGVISDTFLGNLTDRVLSKCATTTLVYRPAQPLSTIKRYVVVVPFRAEREIGFPYWVIRVWNMAKNSNSKIVFYADTAVLNVLQDIHAKHHIEVEFNEFNNWDDFLIISRDIKENDALMIVMSRRNYPSYLRNMTMIPTYLNKYFCKNSCILVYPMQIGIGEQLNCLCLSKAHEQSVNVLLNCTFLQEFCKSVCCLYQSSIIHVGSDDDTGRIKVIIQSLALAQELRAKDDIVAVELLTNTCSVTNRDGALDNHNGFWIVFDDQFNDSFYRTCGEYPSLCKPPN